jgi:hypothetical protein
VTDRGISLEEAELLDKMVVAMGLKPEQVWVSEVGAGPALSEGETLTHEVVCALGPTAAAALGELKTSRAHATHSLGELLQNAAAKRETWTELQRIAGELGIQLPRRGASR